MAEGSFAVAPGVVSSWLGPCEMRDLFAEGVVEGGRVEGGDFFVRLRGVDGHVVDAEVELAEVEEGVVDVFGFDQGRDQAVGDGGAGFSGVGTFGLSGFPCCEVFWRKRGIVTTQGFELGWSPAPVL